MTKHPDPTLERIAGRIPIPEPAYERLLRRRDRKRRNQRLVASSVAIAVFVSAVWLLTGGPMRPAKRPAATPAGVPTVGPFDVPEGSLGLPPVGAAPSEPLHGELVASDGGIHPWQNVRVYADGRVIFLREDAYGWLERRLTPDGLELVRSNEGLAGRFEVLPASAWADARAERFVPSRYLVCTDVASIPLLSPAAQHLLRGSSSEQAIRRGEDDWGSGHRGATCPVVTLEEARDLDGLLRASGFVSTGLTYVRRGKPSAPGETLVELIPLLPDGSFPQCCPG